MVPLQWSAWCLWSGLYGAPRVDCMAPLEWSAWRPQPAAPKDTRTLKDLLRLLYKRVHPDLFHHSPRHQAGRTATQPKFDRHSPCDCV